LCKDTTTASKDTIVHKDMRFALPKGFKQRQFIRELQKQYPIQQAKTSCEHYVYYDTFDWRLYNKSLILYSTAQTLVLQSLETHTVLERATMTAPPVFLSDVPSGSLRERIAPIIAIRALLTLFAMDVQCTRMRIMNNDAKTVVRLLCETGTIAEVKDALPFATCLWLEPVRGYEKEARRLSQWLIDQGWILSNDHLYLRGLAAVEKHPGAYSSKIRVQLQPTLRADEATKVILRSLLHVIKCNEAGVKNDLDTEFLHDFRVAIRRTRSALGQIKGVFPANVTARFQKDFAYLGSVTNRVRDLDVYLLHQERYTAFLPAQIRPDIAPFFAHLQRERTRAFRTLIRRLRSKTCADILGRWDAFLVQPPAEDASAAHASRPILVVARKRIRRRCRSVVQLGTDLLAETDGQQLHALRIACKKLRYILEFFVSLFPGKQTAMLIEHLRALQDNLGSWHDLVVQQEALRYFAMTFSGPDQQTHNTLRAIYSLIHILEEEKQTISQALPAIFTTFAAWVAHHKIG
jgi:CHAD domain-containing protein